MNQKFIIRPENDSDVNAITEVTISAFSTLEISNQTEHFIILALRAAQALKVSLVAELENQIVGHIAFSPISISDGSQHWYGLGPVSVLPAYQKQGIGKALIEEGLTQLRNLNAQGCCLVGHPGYYTKFGFTNMKGPELEGVPQEVFFSLSFNGQIPRGKVTFHEGFMATGEPSLRGDSVC